MQRLYRVLVMTLLGVFMITSTILAAENLIANPSFEEGEVDGLPVGFTNWQALLTYGDGAALSKENAHTGDWSLKFYNPSGDVVLGMISTPVPAEAGKTYRASAWIFAEPGTGKFSLYIEFLNENKGRVSASWVQNQAAGDWELVEITEKAPEGTAYVGVILYRTRTVKGVHYIDDISIVEVQ